MARFHRPEPFDLSEEQRAMLNTMLGFLEPSFVSGTLHAVSMPSYLLHFGVRLSDPHFLVRNEAEVPQALVKFDADGKVAELMGDRSASAMSSAIDFLSDAVHPIEEKDWHPCYILAPMIGRFCVGLVDPSDGVPSYFVEENDDNGVLTLLPFSALEEEFAARTRRLHDANPLRSPSVSAL